MAWIDLLQLATFRGVPFHVEGTEGSYGRRAVVHEYPLRDKPFVEDLGRKARGIVLEAFVIGSDYMLARDALAMALEEAGAGVLVHPYLGQRTVTVTDFKLKESTAEGGMARFTITCVEAGTVTFPNAQLDTAVQVNFAADDALVDIGNDFTDSFTVDGFPEFVSDAASDLVDGALDAIEGLSGSLPSLPDFASAFGPQLGGVRSGLASLLQAPGDLGNQLMGLISGLPGLMGLPTNALKLLGGLFAFGGDVLPVPATTPSRLQQATNQAAIVALVRRTAVVEAARSAALVPFQTYTEAVTVRDSLADQLDELAEATQSDDVYESLVNVRAVMVRDVTVRGADLARTVTITPDATLPALVLAYNLYEDASRDADIISRNNVRHPGFVPGGTPLEVIADA